MIKINNKMIMKIKNKNKKIMKFKNNILLNQTKC